MENCESFKESEDSVLAYGKVLQAQNKEETIQAYDDWDKYDEHCTEDAYVKVPQEIAMLCEKHVKLSNDTVLLDFAGGSGEISASLRTKAKFKGTIDILDGSMNMLVKANKKGINFRCMIQHLVRGEIPLAKESYDAVLCAGAFAPQHLPISAFEECLRLIKPNGYFIMTEEPLPEDSYRTYRIELRKVIDRLKNNGNIVRLESTKILCLNGEIYKIYVFLLCTKN